MSTSPASHLRRRFAVFIITALLVSLGLTRPVWAAENVFQTWQQGLTSRLERLYLQWWPGEKSGQAVLRQALTATQQLRSFTGTTTVELELPATSATPGTIQLTASGPTLMDQLWDPRTFRQDLQVKVQASLAPESWQLSGQLRQIAGDTYLQFNQLPALPGINTSQLLNTWIKLPAAASTPPATTNLAELQTAFTQLFSQAQVSPARPETLGNQAVYALTVTLPSAAVEQYLQTIQRLTQPAVPPLGSPSVVPPVSDGSRLLAGMEALSLRLWVDRQSYLIRQFELPLQLPPEAAAGSLTALPVLPNSLALPGAGQPAGDELVDPTGAAVSAEPLSVLIRSQLDQHNQTFTVTAPAEAQDLQQLLLPFMGSGLPGQPLPTAAGGGAAATQPGRRLPTVGTTELPALTPAQQKVLEEYEQMMGRQFRLP